MTPNEYQKLAMMTDCYKDIREAVLNLVAEAGEVAGIISKAYRDNDGVLTDQQMEDLFHECGDVLWQLTKVVDHYGFWLDMVMEANIAKLKSRAKRGVIHGSGDYR